MTSLGMIACAVIGAVAAAGTRVAARRSLRGCEVTFYVCFAAAACWLCAFIALLLTGRVS